MSDPIVSPSASVQAGGGSTGGASTTASTPSTATIPSSAVSSSPWFGSLIASDGALNHKAWEQAPEHLRSLQGTLGKYKTFEDAMLGVQHLSTLAGKKALEPLPEGASAEAVAERSALLRKVLGVPEDIKAYGFTRPQEVPEGLWNQEYTDKMAKLMQENNVPPSAAKALFAAEMEKTREQIAHVQAAEAEFFAKQDKDYRAGVTTIGMDEAEANALAERAAKTYGVDTTSPIFRNAQVKLALAQVGRAMGESKLVSADSSSAGAQSDLERATSIVKDKSNPNYAAYWDSSNSRHKEVKALVNSYYASAYAKTNPKR